MKDLYINVSHYIRISLLLICVSSSCAFASKPNSDLYDIYKFDEFFRNLRERENSKFSIDSSSDYTWNPNKTLEWALFTSPESGIDDKCESVSKILSIDNPNIYIAKYDSVPTDFEYYNFIGFSELDLSEVAKASRACKFLIESINSKYIKKCSTNDTVYCIRRITDLFPLPVDGFEERSMYLSSCSSFLVTEEGVFRNKQLNIAYPKLYNAITSWNIDEVSSLLKDASPLKRSSLLLFSRAIFKNEDLVEYIGYFCLFPIWFPKTEDDYDW